MLKQRIITAIILIPLFLWVIYTPYNFVFDVVLLGLTLLCGWEWSNLAGLVQRYQKISYIVVLFLLSVFLYYTHNLILFKVILVITGTWWLLNFYALWCYQRGRLFYPNRTSILLLLGIFLLIPMFISLVYLKQIQVHTHQHIILFLLCIVWATDTTAYFSGKYFGKKKLAVNISSGKTIEGFYGGFLGGIFVGFLGTTLFGIYQLSWIELVIISFIITLISVVGDLFESMFKRIKGIKDSGNILPGHGGILDRLDSLTAAAPIFALLLIYKSPLF